MKRSNFERGDGMALLAPLILAAVGGICTTEGGLGFVIAVPLFFIALYLTDVITQHFMDTRDEEPE